MGIKGAMTILKKECLFLGLTMKELLIFIDRYPGGQNNSTIEAYKIYKKENI